MPPRLVLLVCSTLLLGACAPALVWRGHSPDRRVRIEVQERGSRQYLVVDGVPGESWEGIGEVAFTADGREVVYAATRARHWHVVRRSEVGPAFDGILQGSLTLSASGRIAYAAKRGEAVHAVIDQVPGPAYDAIGGLRFAPDGERVAYVARRGGTAFLVVEEWVSPGYEAIAEFAWGSPGVPPGYLARMGGEWYAIIGSQTHGPFAAVGSLRFAADGSSWAFLTRGEGEDRVVRPDGTGPPYASILPRSLTFDATGQRFGYIARTAAGEVAVIDDHEGPPFDRVDGLTFSVDGACFGYVGRGAEGTRIVLDGHAGELYDAISDLTLGTGCRSVAFIGRRAGEAAVIVNGTAFRHDVVVDGSLVLSDDGRHWAALAGSRRTRRLQVIVDGAPTRRPFDWKEYATRLSLVPSESPMLPEGKRILRDWVAAELRLWLNSSPLIPLPCGEGETSRPCRSTGAGIR
jgi:hypothetical protein